jgi:hypothetical protein
MTYLTKQLPQLFLHAFFHQENRKRLACPIRVISLNTNQFNPTNMTKIQLNHIFGGAPPANPFKVSIQRH